MLVMMLRTVIIVDAVIAGTIDPGAQVLRTTGPGGDHLIADRPLATVARNHQRQPQPQLRGAPKPPIKNRSGAIVPVFSAGKSRPSDPRPNRLRCRSIFCPKNGHLQKLSSRSS
jgi:hypothetical protein